MKRLSMMIVGLAVGVVAAEGIFRLRDDGAFPHLNAYVADEALGVRLEPGFEGKIRLGTGPVTSFRINADGYRGDDWSAASEDDILIVGDSQVFGLGVEASETFGAKLAEATGRPVLNAGVPTYGPPEYRAVAREVLEERGAKTVVYVVNVGNDLFEAARPNPERHAVWDGWAVRKETAPVETSDFPGRSWVYRNSHLAFALRKLLYEERHPDLNDAAFPSEGRWQDLVRQSDASRNERLARREAAVVNAALRPTEITYLEDEMLRAQLHVDDLIYDELTGNDGNLALLLRAARATPGDIVTTGPGEAAAPLGATAKLIRQGAAYRAKMEANLRKKAAELTDEARKESIRTTLAERDALAEKLTALRAAPLTIARATSPLSQPLQQMKALCDAHGAELVVLVLPLDVMVSETEWSKYDQDPIAMGTTRVLVRDIASIARSMGVRAVDPTQPLADAEPGAFLQADLHLSPKGHEVVAEKVAAALAQPPPQVRVPGLPKGRSRLPRLDDWRASKQLLVSGSDNAGCHTWLYQEWMLVRCYQKGSDAHKATGRYDPYIHGGGLGPKPMGAQVVEGGGGETTAFLHDGVLTFVAPIARGKRLVADLHWEDHRRRLTVNWPDDQPVADEITIRKHDGAAKPTALPEAPKLCACHKRETGASHCRELMGLPDEDCSRTHGEDCRALLGCAAGDPLYPPTCEEGEVNALARERCYPTCSDACEGECVEWQGVSVCVGP